VPAYIATMLQNPVPPVIVQTPMPPPGVDPNFLVSQVVPLIAGVVAVVAFVVLARWFFHSPIGEAIAEGIRLRRRRRYGLGADDTTDAPRVAALEEQVRMLSMQVSELGERLDFAERLLVEKRGQQLGTGR
jgi:hypothetical protein